MMLLLLLMMLLDLLLRPRGLGWIHEALVPLGSLRRTGFGRVTGQGRRTRSWVTIADNRRGVGRWLRSQQGIYTSVRV